MLLEREKLDELFAKYYLGMNDSEKFVIHIFFHYVCN